MCTDIFDALYQMSVFSFVSLKTIIKKCTIIKKTNIARLRKKKTFKTTLKVKYKLYILIVILAVGDKMQLKRVSVSHK